MKKIILLSLSFISLIIVSFTSNSYHKNISIINESINSNDIKNYIIDTKSSSVSWKGYKLFKSNLSSHYGISSIKEGSLTVDTKKLSLISGKAIVDMASFESQDLNDNLDMKGKLDSHLKGSDFLDVEKFSSSTFEVVSLKRIKSKNYNVIIKGNLTLKGITKPISFKALAKGDINKITLTSESFDINRQDFGVKYKGSGESLINDNVTLQIKLVALPSI